MDFCAHLLATVQPQWTAMLDHPFLRQTADGSLPPGRFETWLRQDYVFVREELRVIGGLLTKAPPQLQRLIGSFIPGLSGELDMFETMATDFDISLDNIEPNPVCHAYMMFLQATVHTRNFAESFAVLYGVERAYYDSWSRVKQQQLHTSPYQRFIDHWSGEAFGAGLREVEQDLDRLAAECGAAEQARMEDLFRLTVRYEYTFWDMALNGADWPI